MFSEAGVTPPRVKQRNGWEAEASMVENIKRLHQMKLQKIWSVIGQQHQGNIARGDRLIARIARVHRDQ